MTNTTNRPANLSDRLAARIDDEFEYDYRVRDAVIDELTILCRTKKISAAKLKDSIIISCIESHMADLEDDAPAEDVEDEGPTEEEVEEIIALTHTRPKVSVEQWNADHAEQEQREAAAKARRGAHADCDHEATKAARAKCRRARAKAAAADA